MEFDLNKKHCYYFKAISDIPRGSRNEKAASDYVVNFAKEHGFAYKQDEVWNVIVDKPATVGYEHCEPVILQAHLDVVCEKETGCTHDFEKDPVDLYVDEEGWLTARGTTLGADDGYGVAYMLAVLDDDSFPHPAISCIFTSMEEIGLIGAMNLKKEDLHGKRLINLDGGGETVSCVSAAGGARALSTIPAEWETTCKPAYKLTVDGLQGGHSGGLIHTERGNANTLAARILKEMQRAGVDVQVADFTGGSKFNAIPHLAEVVFVSETAKETIEACVARSTQDIKNELEFSDKGVFTKLEETKTDKCLTMKSSDTVITYIFLMPDGFQHRSMAIEGLTTSSLNAGVVRTTETAVTVEDLIRSALASHTDVLIEQLQELGALLGVEVTTSDRFSGWSYEENSVMREKLRAAVAKQGKTLETHAAHGGLECGVFKGLVPEMDIITTGPVAQGAHTPEERLDLASFDRSYEILKDILISCAE